MTKDGQKTGGRAKGTPNKATAAQREAIAASGLTPLDFMLGVMRDERNALDVRMDAAKSAAPYCHSKLSAVQFRDADGEPVTGIGIYFVDAPAG